MNRTIDVGGNQGRGDPLLRRDGTPVRAETADLFCVACDAYHLPIPCSKVKPRRIWRLEFDCDGAPAVWVGAAYGEADAEQLARQELAARHGDFDRFGARLVACLER